MRIEVIKAVETFRLKQGWTQTEMAKQIGMWPSNYSTFIAGKIDLPLSAVKKAYVLGVDPSGLLRGGK